ncbi:Alpha-tectorin [Geodia barretti]|uniref:Alpha-tectorin n=1 Tax=Geodia barretti TaxID=519541 RepID=A0AA35S324_GEOBA|nr:Alpha-tectorin [Geodia barretti]
MKTWVAASMLVLIGLLLCHLQVSTALEGSGTFAMLDVTDVSYSTLPRQDDVTSGEIYISSFRFGNTVYYSIYVNTNGFISLGTNDGGTSPSIPGSNSVISPYGADIDTRIAGMVRYTNGFTTSHPQMYSVSEFIRSNTEDYSFTGTRMMVVEWDGVAKLGGSSFSTSTFQAVLITDGYDSYAVFIYQCGGMGWGGATIGWGYTTYLYEEHYLSEASYSNDIGCTYSSTSSAIIYDVYSGKRTTFQAQMIQRHIRRHIQRHIQHTLATATAAMTLSVTTDSAYLTATGVTTMTIVETTVTKRDVVHSMLD